MLQHFKTYNSNLILRWNFYFPGENCHRGAALGALLGANAINKGRGIPESLKDGLQARSEVISVLQQMEEARKS